MKIIIFFALFGLSLANGGNLDCGNISRGNHRTSSECVDLALKHVSDSASLLRISMCEYSGMIHHLEDRINHEHLVEEAIKILTCLGCMADKVLATGQTVEEVLKSGGKVATSVFVKDVMPFLDGLGLSKDMAGIGCKLLSHKLAAECMNQIHEIIPSADMNKLKILKQRCEEKEKKDDAIHVLQELGCIPHGIKGTAELNKLFLDVGLNLGVLLEQLINNLDASLKFDTIPVSGIGAGVISKTVCQVVEDPLSLVG